MFLLLEGRGEESVDPTMRGRRNPWVENDLSKIRCQNKSGVLDVFEKWSRMKGKEPPTNNLWNFLEATDFAYQVVSGQGTAHTTRILHTQGGKIAYIVFVFLGVPLYILTLRATGNRLAIFVYSVIRFFNSKMLARQITENIHIKAVVLNVILLIALLHVGMGLFAFTQKWGLLDSMCHSISLVFTLSNREVVINGNNSAPLNSDRDKLLRVLYNFFSFLSLTVLASIGWSAHHFTRHMRFKAQNQQTTTNGDTRQRCPWVEVTRGQTNSPTKSTRERETDRESVC